MLRNLPKYRGSDPYEALVNFYKDLGWDEKKELDPMKVKLSEKDSKSFMDHVMGYSEDKDERIALGFFYINKGPSGRAEVPEGKVILEPGWLI